MGTRRSGTKASAKATVTETPGIALPRFEREVMVAEAAYYIAESRGFAPGDELADWLAAEDEIGRLLGR